MKIRVKMAEKDGTVFVAKTPSDLQRMRLEKLMKNPTKEVYIADRSKDSSMRSPLEFIRNVWGSSAGAGSGDFHVYRGVRRREYARQKFFTEKYAKEDQDKEFHDKLEAHKKEAEERTSKKRQKRLKKKAKLKATAKKPKKDNTSKGQTDQNGDDDDEETDEELEGSDHKNGEVYDKKDSSEKCDKELNLSNG